LLLSFATINNWKRNEKQQKREKGNGEQHLFVLSSLHKKAIFPAQQQQSISIFIDSRK
jgi:hypothetical protein